MALFGGCRTPSDLDVFEELGGSVVENTQALSAAGPGLSSLAVDASACVNKRLV